MPGASGWALSLSASAGGCASARPSTRSMASRGSAAGTQQHRFLEAADDGGFDADLDRPAVDDQIDAAVEIALHMRRLVGETWPERLADGATTGAPNALRIARATGCEGMRIAMVSRPAVASSATGQPAAFGSTRVSGPGQNASASASAVASKRPICTGGGEIADMGDQRVEGGPSLGLIEAGDGRGIGGVGAEPVDGLGRERDQPAIDERARGRRHRGLAGGQNRCGQAGLHGSKFLNSGFLRCAEGEAISRGLSRSVAQPGRALRSGRRGRRFESCHSDQVIIRLFLLIGAGV